MTISGLCVRFAMAAVAGIVACASADAQVGVTDGPKGVVVNARNGKA